MVGLGILRESPERCYAIRTRNLRLLLGNDEEIARRLADACERTAPPVFDPPQFRNTLDDQTPSSLAAAQEKRLFSGRNTVGLIFGTRLGGLDRVSESIRKAAERPDGSLLFSGDLIQPTALLTTLRRVSRGRRAGTEVVLVDMGDTWDAEAVNNALSFVERQEGRTRVVRPIFVCGPRAAWSRLPDVSVVPDQALMREVWLGPCARDFTRRWLARQESAAYASLATPAQSADLPWPVTLASAVKHQELESIEDVIAASLDDKRDGDNVSDILISEEVMMAFRLLAELAGDALTADELSAFVEAEGASMSPDEVLRFFAWGDRLGVLCGGEGGYRLDATYAAGLARVFGG